MVEAQAWLAGQGLAPEPGPGRGQQDRDAGPGDREQDPDADPVALARTIVLRLLTVRARTRQELAKALAARQVPADAAAAVLDRMSEVGLVDDATFAADWVASRQQRRHLSRAALRRELEGKGVDREQVAEAVSRVDPDDEYAAALALAERKHRSMAGLSREVRYRRLAGALGRRGFGSGLTARVLAEVLDADVAG